MNYFYHRYDVGPFIWLTPFILLELILKGFALWKAAREKQLYWFIALLVINSAGILPALYLILFQKKTK